MGLQVFIPSWCSQSSLDLQPRLNLAPSCSIIQNVWITISAECYMKAIWKISLGGCPELCFSRLLYLLHLWTYQFSPLSSLQLPRGLWQWDEVRRMSEVNLRFVCRMDLRRRTNIKGKSPETQTSKESQGESLGWVRGGRELFLHTAHVA